MKWLDLLRLWMYLKPLWTFLTTKKADLPNSLDEADDSSEERRTMTISFDGIKDAALDALEDSNAKEELLGLLIDNKGIFVEEGRGYLKAIIATFKGGEYNPEKYSEFIAALDDEQLIAEAAATADEIEGLVVRHNAKKKFLADFKNIASLVVRKAIVAGMTVYLGPAAGPIAGFLGL